MLRARKLEAIGIFAGGIAHDYNNALTAIIGNISLAKMEIGSDNESMLEILNDAEKASHRVKELTRQLSTFSKGGKPVKNRTSVLGILQKVAHEIIPGSKCKYTLDADEHLSQVDIDEFQIGHALENIIFNAVEAMPEGGTVKLKLENVIVEEIKSHHEISLLPGKYIRISVKDSGNGISDTEIYSIFDPYYSTKPMASGMGLAVSYAVIKRHNGYIDVKSEAGEGAEFIVYIPVAEEDL